MEAQIHSVATEHPGQHCEIVLVDHAGFILVKSHHHAHRGTEKSDIRMSNIPHNSAFQHQLPGRLQRTGQTVQRQFHLAARSLNQDCKSCNDTINEVAGGIFSSKRIQIG